MNAKSNSMDLLNTLFAEAAVKFSANPNKIVEYVRERVRELEFEQREDVKYFIESIWRLPGDAGNSYFLN